MSGSRIITSSDRKIIPSNPITIKSTAYVTGRVLGGKWVFPAVIGVAAGGVIEQLTITDVGKQNAPMDIIVFSDDPALSTLGDDANPSVDAADLGKVVGWVQVLATHYTQLNNVSIATLTFPTPMVLGAGKRDLYLVAVLRGTPTYGSTSAITAKVVLRRD